MPVPESLRTWFAGWHRDTIECLIFLTRIPVRRPEGDAPEMSSAMRAFPLAGVVVGLGGGVAYMLAEWLGLSTLVAAALAVGVMIVLTGAFHEDGLADAADGLGGGWTREQKLEIMRDSRIGTYGTLALILTVTLRIALIAQLAPAIGPAGVLVVLVVVESWSRGALVLFLAGLPPARTEGQSMSAGEPGPGAARDALIVAGLVVAIFGLWSLGFGAVVLALVLSLLVVVLARLGANAQIGGQTGDVAGATQQLTAMAMLLGFAIIL